MERRLLSTFLDFFDAHIYSLFLHRYNRLIVREVTVPKELTQLFDLLITMWDTINRSIDAYERYVKMMVSVREDIFAPVIQEVGRTPEIWQEEWCHYHDQLLDYYLSLGVKPSPLGSGMFGPVNHQ